MVAYLMVLFALTLGGFYQPNAPRNFVPFRSIEHDLKAGGFEFLVNFLGNLAAFLPMGWLLPGLLGRSRLALRVVGLSLALSLIVEILQGISGRRVADIDDLILNTAGGLIGYGLWLVAGKLGVTDPSVEGCRSPAGLQEWEDVERRDESVALPLKSGT
jgi:glycopeptide antibiotics resistance protein